VALGRRLPLVLLAVVVVLAGCGGGGSKKSALDCSKTSGTPTGGRGTAAPNAVLPAGTYTVAIDTNFGTFTIKLATKTSPANTASFVSLARKGFFNGLIFHRIVQGFVIQGGDPTGTGEGGPGYECVDTPPSSSSYTHGVVAMAKGSDEAAGTGGSQFFVVTASDAQLPPDYAIIGTVSAGLSVVDKIGTFGDANEQPTKRVVIQKATVHVS
jgi:peptidyl-prolyl cis-trans isomerase B (cyclophilin B)